MVTMYDGSGVGIDARGSSKLASEAALSASREVAVAVVTDGGATASSLATIRRALEEIRDRDPRTFSIVYSQFVSGSARARLDCFASGARMLAHTNGCVERGIATVMRQFDADAAAAAFTCPTCGMPGLSEEALHLHFPLYHATEMPHAHDCPICHKTAADFRAFAVHLHNEHGPVDEREPEFPVFAAFTWVVCRRPADGKVLLVHEPAAIAGGKPNYWFPAGRVDGGETFVEAGERETLEEAGVHARIKGVLTIKLSDGLVPRVVLYAEPRSKDSASAPKSVPDFESCGACWIDISELDNLTDADYRGRGTAELYKAVASGNMEPFPLGTPSFAALEDMVHRLTLTRREEETQTEEWHAEIQRVWALLGKDYPADRLEML